ncbi:CaiB/BaiF CoA-transferase family protein [Pseudarthrobacter sp. GA104]|uniref:CaiB/BaiF CoA transferase family protein n=1 Tax=Pseudarthrobacter sp. GA104 TaxID=2676311 RepID=UPI0012FB8E88|nr:CaiB/BaiF CoA-transferase family protein [Pseudarthrobacter sp. GA104]MUU69700.1 CoA transferase [Pseudarthrobacter sp. GA104]
MSLPLSGITVIALEQAVAAPFASRQLADLGANVIKIERPGGGDFARSYDNTVGGLSSHFVWLNRNKKSVTLDLKTAEGIATLQSLIASADVFLQNLAPGAIDRLGIPVSQLRAENPDLITCSISGFGEGGPMAGRKAYDLLIQAEVGLVSITGSEDAPAKAGISIADIAAGMYAYSGILAALYERQTTGEGRELTVSLIDALTEWMGFPYYYGRYGGESPRRHGAHHATIAPYGPLQCRDGSAIIAVQNEREWRSFCRTVLAAPELADDPRFSSVTNRVRNRDELDLIIRSHLQETPLAEAVTRLETANIAYGSMNDVAALDSHPQMTARQRVQQISTPAGAVNTFIPVVTTEGWPPRLDCVPGEGADTDRILANHHVPS